MNNGSNLPNSAHWCTSAWTSSFQWFFLSIFEVKDWENPAPSGKLKNTVKLKNKETRFQTSQRQFVTIAEDFWDLLRLSEPWDQNPQTPHWILQCLCLTVALKDERICCLYFHECIHFQHGWTEQSECDQLSDVTVLYMGSEALSWAFGSGCGVTASAASPQTDRDRYPHRVPLMARNIRGTKVCTSSIFCVLYLITISLEL